MIATPDSLMTRDGRLHVYVYAPYYAAGGKALTEVDIFSYDRQGLYWVDGKDGNFTGDVEEWTKRSNSDFSLLRLDGDRVDQHFLTSVDEGFYIVGDRRLYRILGYPGTVVGEGGGRAIVRFWRNLSSRVGIRPPGWMVNAYDADIDTDLDIDKAINHSDEEFEIKRGAYIVVNNDDDDRDGRADRSDGMVIVSTGKGIVGSMDENNLKRFVVQGSLPLSLRQRGRMVLTRSNGRIRIYTDRRKGVAADNDRRLLWSADVSGFGADAEGNGKKTWDLPVATQRTEFEAFISGGLWVEGLSASDAARDISMTSSIPRLFERGRPISKCVRQQHWEHLRWMLNIRGETMNLYVSCILTILGSLFEGEKDPVETMKRIVQPLQYDCIAIVRVESIRHGEWKVDEANTFRSRSATVQLRLEKLLKGRLTGLKDDQCTVVIEQRSYGFLGRNITGGWDSDTDTGQKYLVMGKGLERSLSEIFATREFIDRIDRNPVISSDVEFILKTSKGSITDQVKEVELLLTTSAQQHSRYLAQYTVSLIVTASKEVSRELGKRVSDVVCNRFSNNGKAVLVWHLMSECLSQDVVASDLMKMWAIVSLRILASENVTARGHLSGMQMDITDNYLSRLIQFHEKSPFLAGVVEDDERRKIAEKAKNLLNAKGPPQTLETLKKLHAILSQGR